MVHWKLDDQDYYWRIKGHDLAKGWSFSSFIMAYKIETWSRDTKHWNKG
jgi:hypothetical protein